MINQFVDHCSIVEILGENLRTLEVRGGLACTIAWRRKRESSRRERAEGPASATDQNGVDRARWRKKGR